MNKKEKKAAQRSRLRVYSLQGEEEGGFDSEVEFDSSRDVSQES